MTSHCWSLNKSRNTQHASIGHSLVYGPNSSNPTELFLKSKQVLGNSFLHRAVPTFLSHFQGSSLQDWLKSCYEDGGNLPKQLTVIYLPWEHRPSVFSSISSAPLLSLQLASNISPHGVPFTGLHRSVRPRVQCHSEETPAHQQRAQQGVSFCQVS